MLNFEQRHHLIGRTAAWLFLASILLAGNGCATIQRGRPGIDGIRNFARVNDSLYRGAQPEVVGYQHLKELGIRTVINLRRPDDVWVEEESLAKACGMTYTNIPMSGFERPTEEQVNGALAVIASSPGPVFVHCKYGCDRAGTIIACYRIQHDGWTAAEALQEADYYGMSPLEIGMKQFIAEFEKTRKGRSPPKSESK